MKKKKPTDATMRNVKASKRKTVYLSDELIEELNRLIDLRIKQAKLG